MADGAAEDPAPRLRAASDNVLIAAEELIAIEKQKRHMAPTDARFRVSSADVKRAAHELFRLAAAGEELADEIDREAAAAELGSIIDTAPQRPLALILDEWRSVERELAATKPGSPEADLLVRRFRGLRAQYNAAMRWALKTDPLDPTS